MRHAVRSMLAQDCPPIDVLLSDDCSSDGTFEVLQEEAEAYDGPHRIILNRNSTNLGVIDHIHRVFSLVDADVMINCAGDDLSHPHRVLRNIEVFESEKPLLACSHAKVEYADGSPAPRVYAKADFYRSTEAWTAATSMQLYLGATAVWHRDIFDKYGPIQARNCFEDLVFGFRAALEGRVAVIDEELVTYRLGRGVTNASSAAETRDEVQARREKELLRDISVFAQRQIDAQTYGLGPTDPMMRRISKSLAMRRLRLSYITQSRADMIRLGARHPIAAIGAILSENRRWRKSLAPK